jgi:hypothetical protein
MADAPDEDRNDEPSEDSDDDQGNADGVQEEPTGNDSGPVDLVREQIGKIVASAWIPVSDAV